MAEMKLEKVPYYYQAIDYDKLVTEYPPAPAFLEGVFKLSQQEIRTLQERRLVEAVERAWQVPFYRRRWESVGLEPGEISTLGDLRKLPAYTVDEMKKITSKLP